MFQIRQCLDTRQPGTDVSILGDPGADSGASRNGQKKTRAKKSDASFWRFESIRNLISIAKRFRKVFWFRRWRVSFRVLQKITIFATLRIICG